MTQENEAKEVEELAKDLKEIRECEIHEHTLLLDGEVAKKLYVKGYRKSPSAGLLALDEKKLNLLAQDFMTEDSFLWEGFIRKICSTFAIPAVTEDDIHEVIKKFLSEYNIVWHIGKLQTAGAGKLLAKAILERLKG